MNKNILIVLAGGFLIAILVAVMVQATLSGGSGGSMSDEDRVQILVAAKDLKVGRELRAGDLKWQDWPQVSVFNGAVVRENEDQDPMDAIEGKMLRSLTTGQPLHETLVAEEDRGNFLSANIKKGMRAVGVSVRSHVLADRLIRPGDYVDVLVTYRVNINSRENPDAGDLINKYAAETVIQNVRVLAVDADDTKAVDEEEDPTKTKKKKSASKATVTLEVTPEAAERLVLAGKMGDIGLGLRSIGDTSNPASDNATTDVGMSRVMTDLSRMRETSSGVRVYNGIQMQEVRPRNTIENSNNSNVSFELDTDDEESSETIVKIDTRTLEGLINDAD